MRVASVMYFPLPTSLVSDSVTMRKCVDNDVTGFPEARTHFSQARKKWVRTFGTPLNGKL